LPRAEEVHLGRWRVLVFRRGASLLSSFFFGLAPALRVPMGGVEQTSALGREALPEARATCTAHL